jgi:hypothetical protein
MTTIEITELEHNHTGKPSAYRHRQGCPHPECAAADKERWKRWSRKRQGLPEKSSVSELLHGKDVKSPYRSAVTLEEVSAARAGDTVVPHKVQSDLWGEW